ncbi:uncharacterized protein MYCFIDRAFT_101282, partial [Pseudocercospora fijiensis CIRAD86]
TKLPSRLLCPSTAKHSDLKSFEEHLERKGSRTNSTTSRGTRYEYRVMDTLGRLEFKLERTGRPNDRGIDHRGFWELGDKSEIRVLLQCKLSKPRPSMIRELHCRTGAPSGWDTNSTMSFLVCAKPATSGVMSALKTSPLPMCFMQISEEGVLEGFEWNKVAEDMYLTGLT